MIRESENFEETSDDEKLSDWQRDNMDYAKRMAMSSNKTDQKLINLYKIRKANELGLTLGFNNKGAGKGEMVKKRRLTRQFTALMKTISRAKSVQRSKNFEVQSSFSSASEEGKRSAQREQPSLKNLFRLADNDQSMNEGHQIPQVNTTPRGSNR